jgi:hypothetical protein
MEIKHTGNTCNTTNTNTTNELDVWEPVYGDVNEVVPELMGFGARNVCKQNLLSLSSN